MAIQTAIILIGFGMFLVIGILLILDVIVATKLLLACCTTPVKQLLTLLSLEAMFLPIPDKL